MYLTVAIATCNVHQSFKCCLQTFKSTVIYELILIVVFVVMYLSYIGSKPVMVIKNNNGGVIMIE